MRQRTVVNIRPQERAARVLLGLAGVSARRGHAGHHWMMLACCLPMLIVIALAVTGVASASALVYALVCVAMMAGMGHGRGN